MEKKSLAKVSKELFDRDDATDSEIFQKLIRSPQFKTKDEVIKFLEACAQLPEGV